MAENKWIVDGHHYTCPDCKKTVAVVINESDEGFEFCPFCGKRMSGQMAENKMAEVAKLFGKGLGEEFDIVTPKGRIRTVKFTAEHGLLYYDRIEREWNKNYVYLNFLCEGKAVIVDD